MIHRHYLVSGRVQGVGFRAFTLRRGQENGLRGRVRNLRDGRVEIMVSGTVDAIREFESAIARGPTHARVEDLEITEVDGGNEVLAEAKGFERESDGEVPWTS